MKLTHPDTDHTVEVADEHAGPYLEQGWVASAKKAAAPADVAHDQD